jgi:hypothetical protein
MPNSFTFTAPKNWLGRDGEPVAADVSQQLNDHLSPLREQCQHFLEEAVQMGVSVDFAKIVLSDMIQTLERNSNNNSNKYN